jgi:hypothetical protein
VPGQTAFVSKQSRGHPVDLSSFTEDSFLDIPLERAQSPMNPGFGRHLPGDDLH